MADAAGRVSIRGISEDNHRYARFAGLQGGVAQIGAVYNAIVADFISKEEKGLKKLRPRPDNQTIPSTKINVGNISDENHHALSAIAVRDGLSIGEAYDFVLEDFQADHKAGRSTLFVNGVNGR